MHVSLARIDALADALDIAGALAASIASDARAHANQPGAREYARERLRCLVESVDGILATCRADDPAPGVVAGGPGGSGVALG